MSVRRADAVLGTITAALAVVTVLATVPSHSDEHAMPTAANTPPEWREVQWSAPFDPWPKGREFLCSGGACGSELRLTIRPKIGFCNCATGVADDDELDRVGDLDLIGDDFSGSEEGHTIAIGTLQGRIRAYRVRNGARASAALGLAAAANCSVVVATASGDRTQAETTRAVVLTFLQRPEMVLWAQRSIEN